jgi:hypothetical protein
MDLAALGAALELAREADTERETAQASAATPDDASTPNVDERRVGLSEASSTHTAHAAADQSTSTALLTEAAKPRAAAAPGVTTTSAAVTTARQSYPTPIKEVTSAQAAPKAVPAALRERPRRQHCRRGVAADGTYMTRRHRHRAGPAGPELERRLRRLQTVSE